jgi:hypothetical protein
MKPSLRSRLACRFTVLRSMFISRASAFWLGNAGAPPVLPDLQEDVDVDRSRPSAPKSAVPRSLRTTEHHRSAEIEAPTLIVSRRQVLFSYRRFAAAANSGMRSSWPDPELEGP